MKNPTLRAAALIVVGLNSIFASDQDVKSRQGGKYHVAAGRTHSMHAYDHARMLQKYAALGDKVPSDVVQEHAAAIRSSADSKMVTSRTNEISQHLRANHNDLRKFDDDFYDSDSDAYYETGEGHFVD